MEVSAPRRGPAAAHPASQTAAQWARERREALQRAAALREQRRALLQAHQNSILSTIDAEARAARDVSEGAYSPPPPGAPWGAGIDASPEALQPPSEQALQRAERHAPRRRWDRGGQVAAAAALRALPEQAQSAEWGSLLNGAEVVWDEGDSRDGGLQGDRASGGLETRRDDTVRTTFLPAGGAGAVLHHGAHDAGMRAVSAPAHADVPMFQPVPAQPPGRRLPWEVELGLAVDASADWADVWPAPRQPPGPPKRTGAGAGGGGSHGVAAPAAGSHGAPAPAAGSHGVPASAAGTSAAVPKRGPATGAPTAGGAPPAKRRPAKPAPPPPPPPPVWAYGNDDVPAAVCDRRVSAPMESTGFAFAHGSSDDDAAPLSPREFLRSPLEPASPASPWPRGALRTPEKRTERLTRLAQRKRAESAGAVDTRFPAAAAPKPPMVAAVAAAALARPPAPPPPPAPPTPPPFLPPTPPPAPRPSAPPRPPAPSVEPRPAAAPAASVAGPHTRAQSAAAAPPARRYPVRSTVVSATAARKQTAPHAPLPAPPRGQAAAGRAARGGRQSAPELPQRAPALAPTRPQVLEGGAAVAVAAQQRVPTRHAPRDASDPSTRQMFDKRHSRRDNRGPFAAAIQRWRLRQPPSPTAAPVLDASGAAALFFVRKRPLFQHEFDKGEFDCVSVAGGGREMVVHNCQMHPDLKRMFVKHMYFPVSRGFGEAATDEQVFQSTAAPLVRLVGAGGVAALFMYGQTGSGKTHTMSALERRAADMLFAPRRSGGVLAGGGSSGPPQVRVHYLEVAGKRVLDLLSPDKREVALQEQTSGDPSSRVEFLGSVCATASSAEELLDVLAEGKARRATSATLCNAASSRSHAVCRITPVGGGGALTLVDCAGSERKEDSMYHNAEQRREGAEINASLHALKECVRMRAAKMAQAHAAAESGQGTQLGGEGPAGAAAAARHIHVPYRSSLLTRILAECFVRHDAALAVIGTVSPSPTDIEHSISTMRAVSLLGGAGGGAREEKEEVEKGLEMAEDGGVQERRVLRAVPPVQWTPADVQAWLIGCRVPCKAPPKLCGRELVRMTAAGLAGQFAGGDFVTGVTLFQALRDAIGKAARARAAEQAERRR